MNNINYITEGLALTATCVTTTAQVNDLVTISADQTVAVSGPGDHVIGVLRWKDQRLNDDWTVEMNGYSKNMTVPFSEAIAAGEFVKLTTPVDGVQTFALWDSETDPESAKIGICWVGGNADSPGEILI